MDMQEALVKIVGSDACFCQEPMSRHTTFRVGGPADYLVKPQNIAQIQQILQLCREKQIPYYVMGNGSNLLVHDDGFRGVIVQIGKEFSGYTFLHMGNAGAVDKENRVRVSAKAGTMLGFLGKELAEYSLAGFEFASGIPGTLGGAIFMNAGAYGGEMKDIVKKVTLMDTDGKVFTRSGEEMEFSYRNSIAAKKGYIVLEAEMEFVPSNKQEILEKMQQLAKQRREKQPLEYPSAGSTFKRPEGYFAGKLISDAGLKGFTVGGAQVSEKHAGFVINTGNATAKDIVDLVTQVQQRVQELYGVPLELEVKQLGF